MAVPGPMIDAGMTRLPAKRELFATDEDFVSAQLCATDVFRDDEHFRHCLKTTGLLVFKPEALWTRCLHRGLALVVERGAAIRWASEVNFDRDLIRRMWKYQRSAWPPDRAELMDVVLESAPSLLVVLAFPERSVPASVELTDYKGPVTVSRRGAHHLRAAISERQHPFFNYVHSADEPADVLRELSVLLAPDGLRAALIAIRDGLDHSAVARSLASALVDAHEPREIDPAAVLVRLHASAAPESRRQLHLIERWLREPDLPWTQLAAALSETSIDPWSLLVLRASRMEMRRHGIEPLIPSCEIGDWTGTP